MPPIYINAIGAYAPQRILDNAELEKMVSTTSDWILERTGIHERRIAAEDEYTQHMAMHAARECLAMAQRRPQMLISSTCTPGYLCPNQSSLVAKELQLDDVVCFDINAACSGLVYALAVARSLLLGTPELYSDILVTASEKMTGNTDYTDRNSCILFGDAASALWVSSQGPGHELIEVIIGSEPQKADLVIMGGPGADHYFRQDGKQVFRFAVTTMNRMIDYFMKKYGQGPQDRFFIVPHQANLRMMQSVAETKKIPFERFVMNIQRHGNTSSASIGVAMAEAWRENRFQPGDLVFLIAFGGGLSWAGAAIRW